MIFSRILSAWEPNILLFLHKASAQLFKYSIYNNHVKVELFFFILIRKGGNAAQLHCKIKRLANALRYLSNKNLCCVKKCFYQFLIFDYDKNFVFIHTVQMLDIKVWLK